MAFNSPPSEAASPAATAAAAAATAVKALLKWKEAQSTAQKPQLLPEDEFIYLNLTLKKIPQKPRTNPFKIPLPHPLFDPTAEVCLIIDDRPTSNLTKESAKKVIKSQNITVSKVLRLSKLKANYKPFEAKRKLCDSYDVFVVDRRVVHLLPKLLGKSFFKKKKLPLVMDLTHKNWREQIERVLGYGLLYMRTGTCCVMKVGKVSMGSEEIVENVVQAINGAVEVVPKKWAGIRSLHLKFSDSLALPVYQALPDVKLRIEGVKGSGGDEVEMKGESLVGEKKTGKIKKKKGRIHEVRYMDVGVDEDPFVSEDDDDDEYDRRKSEDNEFIDMGELVEKVDDEKIEDGSEDDEDESDKRNKGKLARGKKSGSLEKHGNKKQKKNSFSLEGAEESAQKGDKRKSKLGKKLKEGSVMKKAKKAKNRE